MKAERIRSEVGGCRKCGKKQRTAVVMKADHHCITTLIQNLLIKGTRISAG